MKNGHGKSKTVDIRKFDFDIDLIAPSYVLGEEEFHYRNLPGYKKQAEKYKIDIDQLASLLGCNTYRKSMKSVETLGLECAEKSLGNGNIDADQIDLVLLCSNSFVNGGEEALFRRTGSFIHGLGCKNAFSIGVSLMACASQMTGVGLAISMMNTYPDIRNVLLISVDVTKDDNERFAGFGMFSDAATSFVLSKKAKGEAGRRVMVLSLLCEPLVIADPDIDMSKKQQVIKELYDSLMGQASVSVETVKKLFTVNIFRPYFEFLTKPSGFKKNQMFTENIERTSHCWNSDTIINYVDYENKTGLESGMYAFSSVTFGLGGALLLEVP